ncbi:MAG: hypothetical protein GXP22_05225 [Gammaproteobacteria bacterium]|nr:hypothetical protein [Gammaproteobacteria bacterium]
MITFKCPNDLNQLPPDHPSYRIIKDLIKLLITDCTTKEHPYDPDNNGYIVLIEEGDINRTLDEIDMPSLTKIEWEGFSVIQSHFYGVYLGTDDYGMAFVLPDAEWLRGELRGYLQVLFR